MGGAAVFVEFEGFPFANVRVQTVLGGLRQFDVLARAIEDALKELLEDQFLQIVFGAEDDSSQWIEGLAVGEWRACG